MHVIKMGKCNGLDAYEVLILFWNVTDYTASNILIILTGTSFFLAPHF